MTNARPGKDMLVKCDFDGDGTFTTVAGIQTRRLTLNGNLVDITNQDSEGNWREAIAGVDIKSMTIAGDGILAPGISATGMNSIYFNQQGGGFDWQVRVPGLGLYTGRFVLTQMEISGAQNDVVKFSMTLESSSIIAFQPDTSV